MATLSQLQQALPGYNVTQNPDGTFKAVAKPIEYTARKDTRSKTVAKGEIYSKGSYSPHEMIIGGQGQVLSEVKYGIYTRDTSKYGWTKEPFVKERTDYVSQQREVWGKRELNRGRESPRLIERTKAGQTRTFQIIDKADQKVERTPEQAELIREKGFTVMRSEKYAVAGLPKEEREKYYKKKAEERSATFTLEARAVKLQKIEQAKLEAEMNADAQAFATGAWAKVESSPARRFGRGVRQPLTGVGREREQRQAVLFEKQRVVREMKGFPLSEAGVESRELDILKLDASLQRSGLFTPSQSGGRSLEFNLSTYPYAPGVGPVGGGSWKWNWEGVKARAVKVGLKGVEGGMWVYGRVRALDEKVSRVTGLGKVGDFVEDIGPTNPSQAYLIPGYAYRPELRLVEGPFRSRREALSRGVKLGVGSTPIVTSGLLKEQKEFNYGARVAAVRQVTDRPVSTGILFGVGGVAGVGVKALTMVGPTTAAVTNVLGVSAGVGVVAYKGWEFVKIPSWRGRGEFIGREGVKAAAVIGGGVAGAKFYEGASGALSKGVFREYPEGVKFVKEGELGSSFRRGELSSVGYQSRLPKGGERFTSSIKVGKPLDFAKARVGKGQIGSTVYSSKRVVNVKGGVVDTPEVMRLRWEIAGRPSKLGTIYGTTPGKPIVVDRTIETTLFKPQVVATSKWLPGDVRPVTVKYVRGKAVPFVPDWTGGNLRPFKSGEFKLSTVYPGRPGLQPSQAATVNFNKLSYTKEFNTLFGPVSVTKPPSVGVQTTLFAKPGISRSMKPFGDFGVKDLESSVVTKFDPKVLSGGGSQLVTSVKPKVYASAGEVLFKTTYVSPVTRVVEPTISRPVVAAVDFKLPGSVIPKGVVGNLALTLVGPISIEKPASGVVPVGEVINVPKVDVFPDVIVSAKPVVKAIPIMEQVARVEPVSRLKPVSDTKLVTRVITQPVIDIPGFVVPVPKGGVGIPPVVPPPVILLENFEFKSPFKVLKRSKRRGRLFREFAYQPSLKAAVYNIKLSKGKRKPDEFISGFNIRPLISF